MACICGHTAGSPFTQRLHERHCTAAPSGAVTKTVKSAVAKVKKVVKKK